MNDEGGNIEEVAKRKGEVIKTMMKMTKSELHKYVDKSTFCNDLAVKYLSGLTDHQKEKYEDEMDFVRFGMYLNLMAVFERYIHDEYGSWDVFNKTLSNHCKNEGEAYYQVRNILIHNYGLAVDQYYPKGDIGKILEEWGIEKDTDLFKNPEKLERAWSGLRTFLKAHGFSSDSESNGCPHCNI